MVWVFQLPWLRPERVIRANTHDPLAKESASDTIPWIDSPQDYRLTTCGGVLSTALPLVGTLAGCEEGGDGSMETICHHCSRHYQPQRKH